MFKKPQLEIVLHINIASLIKILQFLKHNKNDQVMIKVSNKGMHIYNLRTNQDYLISI